MATNIENIRLELKCYAKKARLTNSTGSFLHAIKRCLNLVYGPERNHIVNIDEEYALIQTLNSLQVSIESINEGDDELYRKVLKAAKKMLTYQAIIHFPLITLTNSGNISHIIRDLYVRLNFSIDGKLKNTPEGVRATGTVAEILTGYVHSHLRRLEWDYMAFQEFCTGSGPINATIIDLKENFDPIQLQMLCNHINEMVCWESIEGVPYVYISEVKDKEGVRAGIIPRANPEITNGFINSFTILSAEQVAELFHFSYGNRLNITASEKLEEDLVRFLEQRNDCVPADIVFKDDSGYYRISSLDSSSNSSGPSLDTNRVIFKFKNISKRIKIIENDDVFQKRKYPNPGYTNDICMQFSKMFRTALGRKNRDEAERTHNYSRQSLAADTAPAT